MNTMQHKINRKDEQRFQKIFNRFKNDYKIEGYDLKSVFDIYLPFWQCKQDIVIETSVEIDKFSRIILEVIKSHFSNYFEVCDFLGIEADSFVTMQFHFLLKNDLIREIDINEYEITYEGENFLNDKVKISNNEILNFEYYVTEQMRYLKNDLTQTFFNPNELIDKDISKKKQQDFSGYKIMESHKIHKSKTSKTIQHKHKPYFNLIRLVKYYYA